MDEDHHKFRFLGQTIKITFENRVSKSTLEKMLLKIIDKINRIYDFARVKLIFKCENRYIKADSITIAGKNQFNIESNLSDEIKSGELTFSIVMKGNTNSNHSKHFLNTNNDIRKIIEETLYHYDLSNS
jgi:hypothetical protein